MYTIQSFFQLTFTKISEISSIELMFSGRRASNAGYKSCLYNVSMSLGLNPGITNTGITDFNCENLGLLVCTSTKHASFVILSFKRYNSSMDPGK